MTRHMDRLYTRRIGTSIYIYIYMYIRQTRNFKKEFSCV